MDGVLTADNDGHDGLMLGKASPESLSGRHLTVSGENGRRDKGNGHEELRLGAVGQHVGGRHLHAYARQQDKLCLPVAMGTTTLFAPAGSDHCGRFAAGNRACGRYHLAGG